jgi:hypothetical protein
MTRPSAEPPDEAPPPEATRRAVLLGAAATVVATSTDMPALEQDAGRGKPFDDGTYFDDGYGWVD